MPGPKASLDYEGYSTSQASAVPDTVTQNDYFHQQATPGAFGAQVGEAVEGLGNTAGQIVQKYQGMINETSATNAETELIKRNAEAKGKFMSTEGLESLNALPSYQETLSNNYNDIRSTLPMGALRQFDMLALRQNANYNSDAEGYTSTQVKRANMASQSSLINASQVAATDPNVANNPQRIGEQLGNVTFAHGAMLDENTPGLQKNADGSVGYADTPEGQNLKTALQGQIDHSKGVIWQNAITTQANQDPIKAQNFYEQYKDSIPVAAQQRIESFLDPKVQSWNAGSLTNGALLDAQVKHQQMLLNPPASGTNSFPNNLGNVKTAEGSANGTQQFQNPATPTDGVILTANNLRNNYQGLTLQQIAQKWTGESSDKVSAWLNNASTASGIAANAKPDLSNPASLAALVKGISVAEKSPQDRALFNDQVIGQGVQASLNGGSPTLLSPNKPTRFATNADGSPVTQADYYAAHREEILAQGEAMAERDFPGNPTYRTMVRERLTNQMNAAISSQAGQYKQDNLAVMKAINGGMSNGKTPMTFQELQQIPGVQPLLDRVAIQDPKFSESIDTLISRVARRADDRNSPNAYDTIQRVTIDPNSNNAGNRISSQDHLDKLLGRSDSTGINMKDYNDSKDLINSSQNWKDFVSKNMKQISTANGNIDGKGQDRAVAWYDQVNALKGANDKKGDQAVPEQEFIKNIQDGITGHRPTRMEQISNFVKNVWNGNQEQAAPSDTVRVVSPDGKSGSIPAAQLKDAIASGYKQVQ